MIDYGMDLDHALRIFRLYCRRLQQDPSSVEAMLLTDNEKLAISKLKDLVKEFAGLLQTEQSAVSIRTA